MSNKKQLGYYIIEGGHDADPDPQQAGRVRARRMGEHGKNVKTKDLPFSQFAKSSSLDFNRPPAPGTIMVGFVPNGADQTGYAHLLGTLTGVHENGISAPGNEVLPFLDQAKAMISKINLPPEIKALTEGNRTGIEQFKKQIQETGEKFKQAALQELPSNGAIFAMTGLRNVPLKNISTALDEAMNAMSSAKLSGLLSSVADLSSLISSIDLSALPQNLQDSVKNFAANSIRDIGGASPSGGFSLGHQVDPASFVKAAAELLKDVKDKGTLFQALQKLQSSSFMNDSLANLGKIEVEVDSIFGAVRQTIDASGNIENITNDVIDSLKGSFDALLQAIPGADIAKPFFENSGTAINSLIERINDPAIAKELKDTVEQVSSTINSAKDAARTLNNSNGKGTVSEMIYSAKQYIARDGRSVPFRPIQR